ncbi:MAG: T9SS type A sorting domain-containing protein [Crocinitomicaceae bacterium]|nr:T9SS type A sorting domain-containing protein [Flavobacteriales bacterium]NQZ37884.1 T9SS type A sorting domain-containing protein [Crocinitomicaceae bacterium]
MIRITLILLLTIAFTPNSKAQIINANPGNYGSLISTLTPNDTLLLAPGNYTNGLIIHNVVGTSTQPIVIMGSGNTTVFMGDACCNTVSIKTSAFVTLQDFKLDGQNIANIDGIKAEGTTGNWAHHIVLKNLLIEGHGANQQTVGISTKCPTWDWVISECTIDGAGTGMYLGNSNGEEPFVNGIIEYNLIKNTIGYNIEIKHQNIGSRNATGMTLNGKTLIRHNVFSKENNASTGGSARPNLLVGNFPASGDGATDHYEIYGNFFWQNPSESLFQGTGNIVFYDNVCVNYAGGYGIAIQSHNSFKPRDIKIFHNTIVSDINWGLRLMDTDPAYQKYIYGNAVFSDHSTPIRIVGSGVSTANELDNIVASISNANNYVNNAANNISTIDLFPLVGSALNSTLIPNSLFTSYTDHSNDFNSNTRTWLYRGAYTGEGTNTGWHLAIDKKPVPNTSTVSISDLTSNTSIPEIQLFPNPAKERAYLKFNNSLSNIDLSIINIRGQVEFQHSYTNVQDIELNTSQLTKGIYFIQIKTPEFLRVLKMIKE